uniref:Uncharacterized protein n=1 Tax=Arundo donax TaxID=35708 RepID=A0A0A9FDK4_ARUDO
MSTESRLLSSMFSSQHPNIKHETLLPIRK